MSYVCALNLGVHVNTQNDQLGATLGLIFGGDHRTVTVVSAKRAHGERERARESERGRERERERAREPGREQARHAGDRVKLQSLRKTYDAELEKHKQA